jgi:WD40 repeat protein
LNIISNREPQNLCKIHPEQKLVNFCKDCRKAICNICKSEDHNNHILEDNNGNFSKEDSIKMLEIIKQKEKQFNIEIDKNEEKMENGINNEIEKLNIKKQNYKAEFENYRNDNQKTFFFLKNLCNRYINNANENNSNNSDRNNDFGNDVMLANHINKFKIIDNNNQKLNSNLDEIINNYKDEQKELKLEYDYGINVIDGFSLEVGRNGISEKKNSNDKREFTCTKTFEGHTEKIVSLIELSSGQLASGSYDNTIRIWNTNTLKEDEIINENGRIFALLEFEKNKLLCGTSNNCINLWEINSPTKAKNFSYSFTGHDLWVISLVKCSQDYFASGSNDSKIKIWDYYNKKCIGTLSGHLDCILSLILLKNNNLCSGSADNNIKLWDWVKGICIATLRGHEKWVKCIFELDNGIILSGSDDKTIRLRKDKKQISVLKGHEHSVRAFCQINSSYFASAGFDNTIKIWGIKTLKCVQNLVGHKSNIICLITLKNYNNDYNNQNSICSSSNDKTIKIWEGTL